MKKTIFYIILILVITCFNCFADDLFHEEKYEFSIGYIPICYHFDRDGDLNENNNGILLSYNKWLLSTFENSHEERSWFIGRTFRTKKWNPLDNEFFTRLNLHVGALYGYEDDMPDIGGWTIGVAPTAEVGYQRWSFEVVVMPFDGGVITGMLKYTWGK